MVPSLTISTWTFRTNPSSPGKVFVMRPVGHWFLLAWLAFKRTMFPSWRFGLFPCHLCRSCSVLRYPHFHLFQNMSAKPWTCLHPSLMRCVSSKLPDGGGGAEPVLQVRSIAGVRMRSDSGSDDTGMSGLAFMIAVTLAMSVVRTSYERWDLFCSSNMQSKIRRAMPIIRFHAPPIWDAWGGLNTQVQLSVSKYFSILLKPGFD